MPKKPIRPIRVEGQLAYVTLTRGYEAIIDAADAHLVDGHNWKAQVAPCTVYAASTHCGGSRKKYVSMHRIIMGEPEGLQVDHIDGNGLNNRRNNLRKATVSQNQYNKRMRADNASGFKGVHFHKQRGKWRAQISAEGKIISLGMYETPEAAHKAYCEASAILHGKFSRVG